MANLFAKSKIKAEPKTSKAKETHPTVDIKNPEFFKKVRDLEVLQENMKRDKTKADMLADQIKQIGKSEYIKMYESRGVNPGSIIVESVVGEETGRIMVCATDKYLIIDKSRAEELVGKFGDEIITEETTYSFDSEMVDKYGEIISRLIEESDEIKDTDKEKIIKAVEKYTVRKGSIDVMKKFGSVSEVMDEINPIVTMRNVEVIKG